MSRVNNPEGNFGNLSVSKPANGNTYSIRLPCRLVTLFSLVHHLVLTFPVSQSIMGKLPQEHRSGTRAWEKTTRETFGVTKTQRRVLLSIEADGKIFRFTASTDISVCTIGFRPGGRVLITVCNCFVRS